MRLSRRQVLASGGILAAGAAVGVGSRPSVRGFVDLAIGRGESRLAHVMAVTSSPPSSVTIRVDAGNVLRPISPLIYGVAHANADQLVALGAQLNRWGGNPNTRYNWVANAWNAARDWEFRNYGDDSGQVEVPGFAADQFVTTNQSVGVETVFTVPAMGWVARNRDKQVQSVGVPTDGGPPLDQAAEGIPGYDPTDNRRRTSVPSFARKSGVTVNDSAVYQDEFVRHLVSRFGLADNGGVRMYVVDNEPDLWSSTHTDVHPVQVSYDQMLATFLEYASAIKSVDPGARVAGPALSGWTSYFYAARDRGSDAYRTHADRQAHGDMPFLPWWLEQVRKHDEQLGMRTLDVLDIHYYPQAAGVFGKADDENTRALRLRSTRSLWDATYLDESWINDTIRLVPRMREWIDQYYPGTRLAIGEWNWGGETSMSVALAAADVLGTFGREGTDMASYWTFPPLDSPTAQAFAMYTHYNDAGDAFGDQALVADVDASPDYVTAYASIDSSSNAIVVIVLNKRYDADVQARINLEGIGSGNAQIYRYANGNSTIRQVGNATVSDAQLIVDLPSASISLVRIPRVG